MLQIITNLNESKLRLEEFDSLIKNLKENKRRTSIQNLDLMMEKVIVLKMIYNKIWELFATFNKCYGISVICITTTSFVQIVVYSYKLYLDINGPHSEIASKYLCMSIIFEYLILMYTFCSVCQECTQYVSKFV